MGAGVGRGIGRGMSGLGGWMFFGLVVIRKVWGGCWVYLIRLAAVRHRSENYGLAFDIIAKAVHADSEPPLAFAFGDTVKFLDLVTLG